MSEVFKATSNGSDFAIKVLRQYFKDNQSYIDRIEKEAQTLSLISNERVVKFYEITKTDDGRLALVFELVDGENIETLIQRDQETPRSIVASCIVSEVLLGLEDAHRHDIVHRDLKPENIMLTKKGRIKITDFGVAKNLESQELTVTGIIVGSPAYMSPEQAMGKNVDHRSDLFSLGILLYKIATGKLPFNGNNYQSMVNAIFQGNFISPEKHNSKIHPELSRIIKKSLSKNLNERYQKAYEFRYDLMKYLDHIQCPSISKVLTAYYNQDQSIEEFDPSSLIKTIMMRANVANENNDKAACIQLVQQVLNIDPQNKEAKKLLSPKKNKTTIIAASFILLLTSSVAGFFFLNESSEKNPEITDVKNQEKTKEKEPAVAAATPAKKKVITKQKPKAKKKVTKKVKTKPRPKKIVKRLPPTKVVFLVDNDVKVYMSGKIVKNPAKGLSGVKPGEHEITLIKPGFAPILGKINVIKGQTTTINTRSN